MIHIYPNDASTIFFIICEFVATIPIQIPSGVLCVSQHGTHKYLNTETSILYFQVAQHGTHKYLNTETSILYFQVAQTNI